MLKLSQSCFKIVSRLSQSRLKVVSKLSQCCLKVVLRLFQSCFLKLSQSFVVPTLRLNCLHRTGIRDEDGGGIGTIRIAIGNSEGGHVRGVASWLSAFYPAEVAGMAWTQCYYWGPVWSGKCSVGGGIEVSQGVVSSLQVCLSNLPSRHWYITGMGRGSCKSS